MGQYIIDFILYTRRIHIIVLFSYEFEYVTVKNEVNENFREFNLLSTRALQQAVREETMVCERLNLLLDILVAHRILCERHERGVSADHQRALSTMLSLKKRQMQGVIRGTDVRIYLRFISLASRDSFSLSFFVSLCLSLTHHESCVLSVQFGRRRSR